MIVGQYSDISMDILLENTKVGEKGDKKGNEFLKNILSKSLHIILTMAYHNILNMV